MRTDDTPYALVTLLLIALGLGALLVRYFRSLPKTPPPDRVSQILPPAPAEESAVALCVCGAAATEPSPTLERGRGSVFRDLVGLPPAYRRVVRRGAPLAWCLPHSHLADGLLAEFITEIRASFAQAYRTAAQRAAAFETEDLPRRVAESLTDVQRKRRPAPLRSLRNGTTDAGEAS